MRILDTTALITIDGLLTVQVPQDIQPGQHHIVVVIDEQLVSAGSRPVGDFPVIRVGVWPADLSLRREDMYGDEGR